MQPVRATFIPTEPSIVFPGMTVMQRLMSRSGSALRKAAVVLAAIQIVMFASPLTERGGSASAHVESSGEQGHYAHNEEFCLACVANKMFEGAVPADRFSIASFEESAGAIMASDSFNPTLANGPPRSRAPPSTLVG
jgi:hypothetical protein